MNHCEWWNKFTNKINRIIPFPDTLKHITNSTTLFNSNIDVQEYINETKYPSTIKFKSIGTLNFDLTKKKIINRFTKCKNKLLKSDLKRKTKIKTLNTKMKRALKSINKCTRCEKVSIHFTKKQQKILKVWFNECNDIYNFGIDKYNNDSNNFKLDHTKIKVKLFNDFFNGKSKKCPYDILTDEVKTLCANIKSCLTNFKRGYIKFFNMTHKKINKKQTIMIPIKSITNDGIFIRFLGKINNFGKNVDINKIVSDCKLTWDKTFNTYMLFIPQYINNKIIKNRQKIVALDPGEKIFMSYYGLETAGYIGKDIRIPILEQERKIRRYQRMLNHNKNKNGEKIKRKRRIILRINRCYRKIKGLVNELHKKTALYLCKNYDRILIPTFGTQNMIKNKKKILKKIRENKNETDECEKKKYKRVVRLNSRVKFVLNMLSHYKFRQQLFSKGEEYGCQILEVNEAFTSQCCTKCGMLSSKYKNRVKECENCKYESNRDINGSRNILLKNLSLTTIKG